MADIQTELEILKKQVAELRQKNEALEALELARLKVQYDQFTNDILEVVSEGDDVQLDFNQLVKDMEDDQLFIDLTNVNNPSSEILGFRFAQVLVDMAKDHFLSELDPQDHPRFNRELANAVHSPVLRVLFNSNPVTHLITRVVEKVSSFVKSINFKGHKFVSVEKAFSKVKLERFIVAIGEYIAFYDLLVAASNNYNADKRKLKDNELALINQVDNYHENFLKILNIEATSGAKLWKEVFAKFNPDALSTKTEFLAILEEPNHIKAHKIAVKFPELKAQIYQFKQQYQKILIEFFKQNLKALQKAHTLSSMPDKLEQLENRISRKIELLEEESKAT